MRKSFVLLKQHYVIFMSYLPNQFVIIKMYTGYSFISNNFDVLMMIINSYTSHSRAQVFIKCER